MNRKNTRLQLIAIIILIFGAVLVMSGCSRKQIDIDTTNSVAVEGTNWWRFCDGPNAVMWTKGIGAGSDDEIEAYVYDHWACAPDYYKDEEQPATTNENTNRGDEDGLLGGVDDDE